MEEKNRKSGISAVKNSECRGAEEARRSRDELELEISERTAEIKRANRALRMLYECNQIIVHATDELDLLHDICRTIVETGGYRMSWVGYAEHDKEKKVRPVAQAGYEDGYLETLNITWADSERGRGPTGTAVRTGKTSIGRNFLTDRNFGPWRAEALKRGYASSICLPLIAAGSTLGALTMYAVEPDAFDAEEVKLLKELADDIANCILALRLRVEHNIAEEALHRSAEEIEDLYNNAPCGYHSLDHRGIVVRINDTELSWLGYSREEIIGKMRFSGLLTTGSLRTFKETFPLFKSQGWIRDLEYELVRKDGTILPVLLSASAVKDNEGNYVMSRSTVYDITERKEAENRTRITNVLLELFAKKSSRKEYVDAVVGVLQEWSSCRCVGIRVVNDQGCIPYESFTGFSKAFWKLENMLSIEKDSCACIRAITGKFEPMDRCAITANGSFHLNNSVEFLNQLTEEGARRFRSNCMRHKFLSIAIVPVRYREQTLGAIHLADEREGMVQPKIVQFVESMAPLIGEAIHRFNTEAELHKAYDTLELRVRERTSDLSKANEALAVEIKERMKAEEGLKDLTEELKRSNSDLEQFAYAASHDLQEPLRVVAGFVKLLEKRYKADLDERAHEYIDFAVDGVKRMQMLIKDLLEYSQVGTKRKVFDSADCLSVLQQALSNLRTAIEESVALVTFDSLPTVTADSSQLSRLFQNLVGNAIKFHGAKTPKIHISAEQKGNEWVFSVSDNGIGLESKHAGRIFVIFQRLHTREEYEGTGIGLSVCKKIVERHGGRIWVESEPGKGSTFYFTIPVRR